MAVSWSIHFFSVHADHLNNTVGNYLYVAAHDFVYFPIVTVKLRWATLTPHCELCWPTSKDGKDEFSVGLAVIDGLRFTGCLLLRSGTGWLESFDFVLLKCSAFSLWWDSVHLGRKTMWSRSAGLSSFMFLFSLQPPVACWLSRSINCTRGIAVAFWLHSWPIAE